MEVPDRLSIEKTSPYYDEAVLRAVPFVLFNGVQQTSVVEYCISEGWIRRQIGAPGRAKTGRGGKILAFKATGKVEVTLR